MTEMYLWVGIVWYDACVWVSVYVKLSAALAVWDSLWAVYHKICKHTWWRIQWRWQLYLFSLANFTPVLLVFVLFYHHVDVWYFTGSSPLSTTHIENSCLSDQVLVLLKVGILKMSIMVDLPTPVLSVGNKCVFNITANNLGAATLSEIKQSKPALL